MLLWHIYDNKVNIVSHFIIYTNKKKTGTNLYIQVACNASAVKFGIYSTLYENFRKCGTRVLASAVRCDARF